MLREILEAAHSVILYYRSNFYGENRSVGRYSFGVELADGDYSLTSSKDRRNGYNIGSGEYRLSYLIITFCFILLINSSLFLSFPESPETAFFGLFINEPKSTCLLA